MRWQDVFLGDICSPKQHKTIPSKELLEEGYPVFGANGQIGFYSSYTHSSETIAITCRGATCGTINVAPAFSYITGNAMALDSLDSSRVCLQFLAYLLMYRGFDDVISGSAQPQITREPLVKLKLTLPPLDEQRRIAAILDQADDLRRKRREALGRLSSLPDTLFFRMFGHPLFPSKPQENATFRDVTSRITYGFTSPMRHLERGIPILTAKNIRDGYIDFENVHYADQSEFDALTEKSKPERGDLLLTKDGTLGRCAVVMSRQTLCINQSVALIKPRPELVDSVYILAYMQSKPLQDIFRSMGKGNAIAHLQITELASLPIPLPPLPLQRAFAARVAEIDKLKAHHRAHLARLDALFASLQHRAFRGDLPAPSFSRVREKVASP